MTEEYLFNKWDDRIGKGWYGFDGIPDQWVDPIDKLLQKIEKLAPDFVIHQIKLKWGGLRFYVDLGETVHREELEKDIDELEKKCFDKELIY